MPDNYIHIKINRTAYATTYLKRLMKDCSCTVTHANWDSEKLPVFDKLYNNQTLAVLLNSLYKSVSYWQVFFRNSFLVQNLVEFYIHNTSPVPPCAEGSTALPQIEDVSQPNSDGHEEDLGIDIC